MRGRAGEREAKRWSRRAGVVAWASSLLGVYWGLQENAFLAAFFLVFSFVAGWLARRLWLRFVEKPDKPSYLRGACVGLLTVVVGHVVLTVLLLPFGLLGLALIPLALVLASVTVPASAVLGASLVAVRRHA